MQLLAFLRHTFFYSPGRSLAPSCLLFPPAGNELHHPSSAFFLRMPLSTFPPPPSSHSVHMNDVLYIARATMRPRFLHPSQPFSPFSFFSRRYFLTRCGTRNVSTFPGLFFFLSVFGLLSLSPPSDGWPSPFAYLGLGRVSPDAAAPLKSSSFSSPSLLRCFPRLRKMRYPPRKEEKSGRLSGSSSSFRLPFLLGQDRPAALARIKEHPPLFSLCLSL